MEHSSKSLWHFLQTPAGRYLQDCEERFFQEAPSCASIAGDRILQIGLPEFNLLPVEQACRFYLTSAYHHPKAQLLCLPEFLPFADKSMDIVIAPHVLENSDNPHQTLREIERILIPEGFLILSGINARSLWRFQNCHGIVI